MGKKRRKVFRRQADRSWKELKPRKRGPGRPPNKKLSPYMKRKLARERAEREAFDERMRKSRREPLDHERKRATADWTQRQDELHELLRPMIREAARTGLVEAIEHSSNFWNVSDGYKNYIDHQIETQAEALMAAVRKVVTELILVQNRRRKQR